MVDPWEAATPRQSGTNAPMPCSRAGCVSGVAGMSLGCEVYRPEETFYQALANIITAYAITFPFYRVQVHRVFHGPLNQVQLTHVGSWGGTPTEVA